MSEDDGDTGIKISTVPPFDGKYHKFQQWWTKFMSYAYLQGFANALGEQAEPDLPASFTTALDPSIAADKKKILARNRNSKAIHALSIAFKKESLLGMIHKSVSSDCKKTHSDRVY